MPRFRSARMQIGAGARKWHEMMAELDAEAADAGNDGEPDTSSDDTAEGHGQPAPAVELHDDNAAEGHGTPAPAVAPHAWGVWTTNPRGLAT